MEDIEELDSWKLARVKFKCMTTVLSLLEGRTDNYNLTKMLRAFPLDILKANLVNIHNAYKELYSDGYYGSKLFHHFDLPESDEEEELEEQFLSNSED